MPRTTPLVMLLTTLALAGCADDRATPAGPAVDDASPALGDAPRGDGRVVVANRASGTISVIDARSAELSGTYALPQAGGEPQPEPMYVNFLAAHQRVFVGDRANARVAVFDARTFEVLGTVPAGQGVFHQWVNPNGEQLWVNNDIDNTATVIDARTLEVIATVDVPADLVAMGGKPHDVTLDPRERWGYITVLGIAGPNDYVVQYDATTYTEVDRHPVGKDPHLKIGVGTDLYVASQNSNQLLALDPATLAEVADLAIPGAHGVGLGVADRFFYTTNLPGGGTDALYTVLTATNALVGDPVDTPYPVPHNLAIDPSGRRLFVTHSGGTADKVTVFDLVGPLHTPQYAGEVTVGLNPFGIDYVF
jgi:YVTN family beta-propeller protein